MDSAKPRLYGLIKYRGESYEGSRGAHEPLDQRGIHPMAKIASPPLYIERNPLFWSIHPLWRKSSSLAGQGGGKPHPHQHQVQGRRRGKGPLPPRAAAPLQEPPPPPVAAAMGIFIAISSTGCTSSSTYIALLHHLPTVIFWKTWCLLQSIIFPWSIVFLCPCLSSDLFMAIVR